jgi:hypothetical protein
MNDKDIIKLHLTNSYIKSNNKIYFSGFCGGLKDARKMTGRNLDTGEKDSSNKFGHLGSWLGTIGYLSILDQIGTCFKKIDGPIIEENKSGIIKALKQFTNLSDDVIDAIYALRNSFAHDFSLQNVGRRPGLIHHFIVDNSNVNPLITLPTINWDGIIQNKSNQNVTLVNLQALGDCVELLITNLINLNNHNQVEIVLEGGKNELIERYLFVTGEKVI